MNNEKSTEVEHTLPPLDTESVEIQIVPAFKVRTVNLGIMVSAVSTNQEGQELLNDGQLLPAIFPTLAEALSHVDQLRSLIVQHFESAAQVGMRVIAAQKDVVSNPPIEDSLDNKSLEN